MAIIKFGDRIADIRGSIGGATYSRNTYGAYIRNKVTPVNPKTVYQQLARQHMATLSQGWSGLTDAQKKQWNMQAPNWSRSNIFGDNMPLSGFNLYMRLNRNLLEINEAIILIPPVPGTVPGFNSLSFVIDVALGQGNITFAPAIDANIKVIVTATAPVSPGVEFVSSEYRKIEVLDNADVSPYNIAASYVAKFGAVGIVGNKIFVQLKPINKTTGQAGTTISAFDIAS